MKKKIVIAVIAVTIFSSPVFAGKRVKIYDEKSHWIGFVENGKIYDSDYRYKGHIEKSGRIYNEKSHYKGKIEKDSKKKYHNHDEDNDD